MAIQPTWNSYKMQSWLGITSGYYPWSVYYKMYTQFEAAGAGTYNPLPCLWVLNTRLWHGRLPLTCSFSCLKKLVVSAVKEVQL